MVARYFFVGSGLTIAIVITACGSSGPESGFDPGSTVQSGEAGVDDGGSLLPADDGGGLGPFGDGSTGPDPDALAACATDTQQAKQLPLDLYLMLDTSGSMTETTSGNTTKWDAVKAALTSFVGDPGSAGIGLGLQYFPLFKPNVPASCTSSAQCGAGAPCFLKACDPPPNNTAVPCDTAAQCGGGQNTCDPIGSCRFDNTQLCFVGQSCGPLGPCDAFTSSVCANRDSCTASDYSTPAVPIAALPGVASAVTTSLGQHSPDGSTPTSAALQGAVTEAKTYAGANPGHTVVAVLATDGLPTECDTNVGNIAAIASGAVAGTPSIKTFVIGVFAPAEQTQAQPNLDQIAAAGGTTKSFIINTSQNVSQQFLAALNAIRGSALPCEYTLPVPESGTPDYGKVNVEYTAGNGAVSTVPYAKSAANCGAQGGWYYDVDPATGTPTKIIMCPATCNTLKADPKGRIDVLQGCATIGVK